MEIPAKALRLEDEIGSIGIGKKADFVIADMNYELHAVILNGKVAKFQEHTCILQTYNL